MFYLNALGVSFSHNEIFKSYFKAESQNFLDPVLAKPESYFKARF